MHNDRLFCVYPVSFNFALLSLTVFTKLRNSIRESKIHSIKTVSELSPKSSVKISIYVKRDQKVKRTEKEGAAKKNSRWEADGATINPWSQKITHHCQNPTCEQKITSEKAKLRRNSSRKKFTPQNHSLFCFTSCFGVTKVTIPIFNQI